MWDLGALYAEVKKEKKDKKKETEKPQHMEAGKCLAYIQ